jgi:DNA (cytosine-5)-methyltransferase 1
MADVLPNRKKFVVVSNYGTGGNPKDRGRRRSDEPSATVTGKISRNRLYSSDALDVELPRFEPPEYGRLQTFPHDYPWAGKQIAQQVGNAIPPRLAAHVLAAALGKKFTTDALNKAVDADWDAGLYEEPLLPTTEA